jgi:hypothetical protein
MSSHKVSYYSKKSNLFPEHLSTDKENDRYETCHRGISDYYSSQYETYNECNEEIGDGNGSNDYEKEIELEERIMTFKGNEYGDKKKVQAKSEIKYHTKSKMNMNPEDTNLNRNKINLSPSDYGNPLVTPCFFKHYSNS